MQAILCESIEDYDRVISKWSECISSEAIVITNNPLLKNEIENVRTTVLLEIQENLDEDIAEVIGCINSIIRKSVTDAYIYEVSYHVEGGGCQEGIKEILYGIKAIMKVVTQLKIDEVFTCFHKEISMEIKIMKVILGEKSYKVHVCYSRIESIIDIKNIINFSDNKLLRIIKQGYLLVKSSSVMLTLVKNFIIKREREYKTAEIGIIFESDAIKHFNWNIEYLKKIKEYATVIVICCFCPENARKFCRQGIRVTKLEDYPVRISLFFKSLIQYVKDLIAIEQALKSENIHYLSLNITRIVREHLECHLRIDCAEAWVCKCLCDSFFKYNRIKTIEAWVGSNDVYSRIFYNYVRKQNTIFWKRYDSDLSIVKPLTFREVDPDMLQYIFFIGANRVKNEECYRSKGWNGHAVLLPGKKYIRGLNYVPLNKQSKQLYVLWAPSYPFGGYMTRGGFVYLNQNVVDFFLRKDMQLFVKYHNNQDKRLIEEMYKIKNNNLHLYDANIDINNVVSLVDIVVTTISTVAMDAVKAGKPSVIVTVGQNRKWLNDGCEDAFFIINSLEELYDLMENITESDLRNIYNREQTYVNSVVEDGNCNVEKEIVDNLGI